MDAHQHLSDDARAERTTRVIAHLDQALDVETLSALQGVWSTLEHASTSGPSHARAVRERLLWASLSPGEPLPPLAIEPGAPQVSELVASWDDDVLEDAA